MKEMTTERMMGHWMVEMMEPMMAGSRERMMELMMAGSREQMMGHWMEPMMARSKLLVEWTREWTRDMNSQKELSFLLM